MTRLPTKPRPRGFVARPLQDLVPRPSGRDWDIRFVTATLLLYGLVGASFFLVGWLNPTADEDPLQPGWQAGPPDDAVQRAREPYLVRLPQVLKDRDAAGDPQELR